MEHIVAQINSYNASLGPLFAYIAWHNCHAPPQVPNDYLANFSFIDYEPRQVYAAKANFMASDIAIFLGLHVNVASYPLPLSKIWARGAEG